MPGSSGSGLGAELFKLVVQALLIVVGWMVVHRQAARRYLDKARREMVAKSADAMSDQVTQIMANSRTYHTSVRDESIEIGLKSALQDVSLQAVELAEICKDAQVLTALRSSLLALRRSVTAVHFEDEHDHALPRQDRQLESIASDALRAKQLLLKLKHAQFEDIANQPCSSGSVDAQYRQRYRDFGSSVLAEPRLVQKP
ncbi:MAG: hypothetical protein ABI781_05455 [Burkholderiales bacterium]